MDFFDSLVAARRSGVPFTPSGSLPTSTAEAYAVQTAVAAVSGKPAVSRWRGRAPSRRSSHRSAPTIVFPPAPRSPCPAWGWSSRSAGWSPVRCPRPGTGIFRARLVDAVRPVPVIELLERRIAGPLADAPIVKLADGLLKLGPDRRFTARKLGRQGLRPAYRVDAGGAVGPSRRRNLGAGRLGARKPRGVPCGGRSHGGVRSGQVVITGTLHPMTEIEADADVWGEIEGLGSVGFALRGPTTGVDAASEANPPA